MHPIKMPNEPAIVVAAARSGTKMLRAALAKSSDLVDFPFDINYIWKFGNYHIPHDELTELDVTTNIRDFIAEQFHKLLNKSNARRVLEKTVSNSLRVSFVRSIFPNSKIIHLYRDGRDVAADARLCWQSSMLSNRIQSKRDLVKKIVTFPVTVAFPYLVSYLRSYAQRAISANTHVSSWGPRFQGIEEALKRYSLIEVCGMQWSRSVRRTLQGLAELKEGIDFINVKYEELVSNPTDELQRIGDFLQIFDYTPIREFAETKVTSSYVGFWKSTLTEAEMAILMPHIGNNLIRLGYS